jgi:hypothetical protein
MGYDDAINRSQFATIGKMLDNRIAARVCCDRCDAWQDVDLAALAARVGRDYSLVDRRCRCKLTPGCRGWNRFLHDLHGGMFSRLWTNAASDRWFLGS